MTQDIPSKDESETDDAQDALAGLTAEELDKRTEELNAEIIILEQKVAFADYFQNQTKNSDEQMVKLPFSVVATRDSKASVVVPKEADCRKIGLVVSKESCVMAADEVLAALVENAQE